MNISLITACKNRNKPLLISLQSWLLFDEIKEIIIVDWSSDEPLSYLAELDPRIKVITVSNKKYFNQPQPLNLAASIATGDSILKVDVDHIFNPYWNFLELYSIDDHTFFSGSPNYKNSDYIGDDGTPILNRMDMDQLYEYCGLYSPFFKSLVGILHVTKENFFKCGGFNENMGEFYGFEDQELYSRLENLGLNHKKLNQDTSLIHIPHPDSKRLEFFKANEYNNNDIKQIKNNIDYYYDETAAKYQFEYALAQYHIHANEKNFSNVENYYISPKTKWNITQNQPRKYIATEMNNLENFPPVYYVTLEESVDRQKQIESEFERYGIVPKAIKSKRFSESNDTITGKYVYQLSGPTQGCVVSHLKAIKTWYESGESDYAFFCEDDLSLRTVEYWNFKWEEFIERLPDDCDCVQLMTIRGDFDGVYFRERNWDDCSETAYIINRDYAKKIIDNYCIGDTFHLEIKDVSIMPIGENILFTNIGKVYTFPLFVENVNISTTDVNDLELENGQKPNHMYSSEYVYHWWKNNGKIKTIDELMGATNIKKSFVIMDDEEIVSKDYKIVDCFSYFNEKELLELRINLLKDHVEKFIITEANYTHSGIPKEYTLKDTIKELGLPEDKIQVIEIDLENPGQPDDYDLYFNPNRKLACRERLQRDSILQYIDEYDDNTYFICGDCDEIINPKHLDFLVETLRNNTGYYFKVPLVQLECRADLRAKYENGDIFEWKNSLFICSKEYMKLTTPSRVRANYNLPYYIVHPYIGDYQAQDLGWHFSWMGSNQNRIKKSQSISQPSGNIDFLKYGNYKNNEMIQFLKDNNFVDGSFSPSGLEGVILKSYPLNELPQIIFDLPRVKNFLLADDMKTELEHLLYGYSLDTENPQNNFNLGLWYEKEGHTAPALSYFLRCAERSENQDFAYEALLKSHHCYARQGTRDVTAISLLQQAICLLPKRPEAYFLLARFHEKRSQWNDSYKYASLGLSICDFDCEPLTSNVEYPGKYGLLYEKGLSGWWWGKNSEMRNIFKSLLVDYDLPDEYKNSIIENLKKVGEQVEPNSSQQSDFKLVQQDPSSFRFDDSFDWGEMTYEHIITIDREIAHENVYGFWKTVSENDIVMDVGASVGPFIYSILDNKPKKVYCVEPSSNLMKTLAKNCAGKLFSFKENPLVYVNKAIVSDYEDNVNIFGSTFDFEKTTFNEIIKDYSIEKIDFLKIDCEGGEYNIFTDENIDFLLNNVKFVAMEVHLNYDGFREKFKNFRDKYLTRFDDYQVVSCTRQNISWGNNVDLKEQIFNNDFVDNYNCEFMIYINNEKKKLNKIFFDCGTHMFQGFKEISKIYSFDKNWICYCLEANPSTFNLSKEKYLELINSGLNINHFNNAVSDKESIVKINCAKAEYYDETDVNSFTSQASNILSNRPDDCSGRELFYDEVENQVESIDFSEFIKEKANIDDFVVVKLDIEGSEFDVLDRLIEQDTLKYINEIYIEFHPHFFDNSDTYVQKMKEYENLFEQMGIKYTQWY